jgi:hypothetical protein
MAGAWIQISAIAGCAGVALRYTIQLVIVIWSLRADAEGRQHALQLLLALRGERLKRRRSLPKVPQ